MLSFKKTVGDFRLDTEFSISGQRTGIFGPSGSGKSTLMTKQVLVVEQGQIRQQVATEDLAGSSWNCRHQWYVNLLKLGPSSPHHDLYKYQWGILI